MGSRRILEVKPQVVLRRQNFVPPIVQTSPNERVCMLRFDAIGRENFRWKVAQIDDDAGASMDRGGVHGAIVGIGQGEAPDGKDGSAG